MFKNGLSYLKAPLGIGFIYVFLILLPLEWIGWLMTPFLESVLKIMEFYEASLVTAQSEQVDLLATFHAVTDQHGLDMGYITLALIGILVCSLLLKTYLTYTAHRALIFSGNIFLLPKRQELLPKLTHREQIITYVTLLFKLIILPFAMGGVFLFFWAIFGAVCLAVGFVGNIDYETVLEFLMTDGLLFMSLFGVFYMVAFSFYFLHDFHVRHVFDLRQNMKFIQKNWLRMIVLIGIMVGVVFLLSVAGVMLGRMIMLFLIQIPTWVQIVVQALYLAYAQLFLSIIFGKTLYWTGGKNTRG